MNKQKFMLKKASVEWNQSEPKCFVRTGILEHIGISKRYYKQRFSQLSKKIQNKLAKFVEIELEYSDDWRDYLVEQRIIEVVA